MTREEKHERDNIMECSWLRLTRKMRSEDYIHNIEWREGEGERERERVRGRERESSSDRCLA